MRGGDSGRNIFSRKGEYLKRHGKGICCGCMNYLYVLDTYFRAVKKGFDLI